MFLNLKFESSKLRSTKIKTGIKAPEFSATDENGKPISLRDYAGKKLVLYFYPQDLTPTCTDQACNLRDHYATLAAHGFSVVGVSPDEKPKHEKFISRYQLPFPLIPDPDLAIIKQYGVWGKKQLFGRKYMGVLRTTFLIDEAGFIRHIIDKPKSKSHAEEILALDW